MDIIKQQPPFPDTQILKSEKPNFQREPIEESVLSIVADTKREVDSSIENISKTVQIILNSLEDTGFENQMERAKKKASKPEKILKEIKDEFSQNENPSIDDISRILLISGSAIRDVQSWFAKNKHEIQSLLSLNENLRKKISDLSDRLVEEERKNFFTKIFREKARRAISEQQREVSSQIAQIEATLEERTVRAHQIKASVQEISDQHQELAINAAEQLFREVVKGNDLLKEKLTAPEVKRELNGELIAQRIMPELERLQAEGKITKEDAEEYLGILKAQLAEGFFSAWNDPIEKKEAVAIRIKKLDELRQKSGYNFSHIDQTVIKENFTPADNYYDRIFDFLIREMTKERIEELRDTLGGSLSPELQRKLGKITERIINPYSDGWITIDLEQEILDLNKLPTDDFERLKGMERWPIVKKFTRSPSLIPKEIFSRVEKVIIQRLFEEQLFPGGRESWDGTDAAGKIDCIGNPEALPLMLRHIEASGSGHTNVKIAYIMKRMMKESDPTELKQVLQSLPRSKRILLETLADENSYMSRFENLNSPFNICYLLQNGERTNKQEIYTKLLEDSGSSEKELREFYNLSGDKKILLERLKKVAELAGEDKKTVILNYFQELTYYVGPHNPDSLKIIDELAEDLEIPKSNLLVRCVDKFENPPKNQTLKKIVSPKDRDYSSFPLSLAKDKISLGDKFLEILAKIYKTKSLQSSALEREFYIEGLIMLKGKENGKAVLETLLGAYSGTKKDPSRMRRVFQLLSTLDSFGEYDFVVPSQDEIDRATQEITELQDQYSQTQNKAEKKIIKNRIETLNSDLQNLTGLKGIEDAMKQKVVEVACRRLELPQEYRDKIKNNLDELLKSGVFEIVPSLAGKYEGKNETEVQNLLRTITTHIIEGDFKSWRYAHERSEVQLAGLTEEQKEFWKATVEPITIDIELPEGEKGRRADELKAVQEIIRNAKEHILYSRPNFDFSKERARTLATKVSELTEKIKSASSEEEKKRLTLEKTTVQAEATLINGVLEIENASTRSFTRERMLTQARELRERITELNLPLAGLDIEQIEKVFTVGDIKSVTAYESDDALSLLKVGVEPQETCQSWRNGVFNECLLAYVADSNKKVLNVADGEGRVVARSIIKLTNQREENDFESKTQRTTLLIEKPYSLLPNIEVYRAFFRALLIKAQGLEASITFGKSSQGADGVERQSFDEATLQIFEEEARAFGYGMNEGRLDVFIPHSLNKYEYSDTLGGKISWFNRYQQLETITFEKS